MKKILIIAGLTTFLLGCAPATRITGSWKNPKPAAKEYRTVFVAALTGNTIAKSTVEKNMAEALTNAGVSVIKSIDEFPPSYSKDSIPKAELMTKVKSGGAQAILTISLLKKETEERFVSGLDYSYAPMARFGYYGNFWGYYNHWYPYVYAPGYYREDEVHYLETNLYDAETEALLWSAQSETYAYSGFNAVSKEFAKIIVDKMKTDGIFKPVQPVSLK